VGVLLIPFHIVIVGFYSLLQRFFQFQINPLIVFPVSFAPRHTLNVCLRSSFLGALLSARLKLEWFCHHFYITLSYMKINADAAVVLLSGGQDSTTALGWALQQFKSVSAISFDYGQRHKIELECAKRTAAKAGIPHRILDLKMLSTLSDNAMIQDSVIEINESNGLPTTFVPGRNLLFVTVAAAAIYQQKIPNIVIGVSQVDYSGYPDCRGNTIKSLQDTIRLGMDFPFVIHTPLINYNKKQTVELAVKLGVLDWLADSHTCYKGERPPCGECPACQLRAKGFQAAGIADPLTP
jgi:7-cyano-7-deazaguanine synthase